MNMRERRASKLLCTTERLTMGKMTAAVSTCMAHIKFEYEFRKIRMGIFFLASLEKGEWPSQEDLKIR